MRERLVSHITNLGDQSIFTYIMLAFSAIIGAGILMQQNALFLLPFLLVGAAIVIKDYRVLYVLLIASLPLSQEIYLPNGLGTDLPSEPLMLAVSATGVLYFISNMHKVDLRFLYHPITVLLLVHVAWTCITAVSAEHPVVSIKFILAKIWYLIPFFFFPFALIRREEQYKKILSYIIVPLVLVVCWVLVRHAGYGFTFATSNTVVYPIFRNHVSYASILVLLLPFLVGLYYLVKSPSSKKLVLIAIPIFIVAIYFSYTRAAQGSVLIAAGAYLMFKWRLARPAMLFAVVAAVLGIIYLVQDNKYLDYAPNFDATITHYQFDNLIEATYKLEDISTMERVHRWVAGGRMLTKRPMLGYGPGNFYNTYQDYTLNEFQTYVSDNPEKSGIHNYFLMLAVEQGIPGTLIFTLLLIITILIGEKLYHRLEPGGARTIVMCSLVCLTVSTAILMFNDMIETDKMGPIFFFSIANIVIVDFWNKKKRSSQN